MLIVLSPAKKLDESPRPEQVPWTLPELQTDIERLAAKAKTLSSKRLQKLMGISENLATLNHQRFQDFSVPFGPDNSKQAIFSFAGDTYIGFDVARLKPEDLEFAQERVAILSGLYGILRPLDLMQPYRLEMGTGLRTRRGPNLYSFWGKRIGKRAAELLADHSDPSLVNLASNEYFKAIPPETLPGPVITPVFRERKDGKARMLMFYAKRARGSMARWAVQQRLDRPEGLKDFDEGGYRFQPDESDDARWVFERPQP